MEIIIQKKIEIDIEREYARLKKNFRGAQYKRLKAVIDAFVAMDFEKWGKLAVALPYCEKDGCPEKEFLPPFLFDFLQELVDTNHLKENNPSNNMVITEVKGISWDGKTVKGNADATEK